MSAAGEGLGRRRAAADRAGGVAGELRGPPPASFLASAGDWAQWARDSPPACAPAARWEGWRVGGCPRRLPQPRPSHLPANATQPFTLCTVPCGHCVIKDLFAPCTDWETEACVYSNLPQRYSGVRVTLAFVLLACVFPQVSNRWGFFPFLLDPDLDCPA